ncbi:hypothetical protein YC2023_010720 [Brassica napus]
MQRRDETDQHRAEASGGRTRFHHPIDIRNNKSTDNHRRTSVDEATNRGRLVPRVTSDMSDTHNHVGKISTETYATLMRHQINL